MRVLWQDATRATAIRLVDGEPEPVLEVVTSGEDWGAVELPRGAGGMLARALDGHSRLPGAIAAALDQEPGSRSVYRVEDHEVRYFVASSLRAALVAYTAAGHHLDDSQTSSLSVERLADDDKLTIEVPTTGPETFSVKELAGGPEGLELNVQGRPPFGPPFGAPGMAQP